MLYKGVLMEGVPNSMFVIGYTNASWTLKADLASEYFCRLVKHMDEHGHDQVLPLADAADRTDVSVMGDSMRSGYIQRGDAVMPRQGKRAAVADPQRLPPRRAPAAPRRRSRTRSSGSAPPPRSRPPPTAAPPPSEEIPP